MIHHKKFFTGLVFGLFVAAVLFFTGCSGEKKAWEKAVSNNSIQAYEDFLKTYPKNKFADEAKTRIGLIYLEEAKEANTITAYKKFLVQYPEGKPAEEVHSLIEKIYPSFSLDTMVKIESIPETIWKGDISFEKVDESGFLYFTMKGTVKVTGDEKDIHFFCSEFIKLAPNLKLPTSVFNEKGLAGITTTKKCNIKRNLKTKAVTINGKTYQTMKRPFETSSIEFNPVCGKIKKDEESFEFIVAGANGAKLKKEGNGYLLVEGEAKLFNKKFE